MKKISLLIFCISTFCAYQYLPALELKSEFIFDMELDLNPPQVSGAVPNNTRVIYTVTSGVVKGDKVNGKVLPGGGDFGVVVDPTTYKLDVKATIQTDDGALIYVIYSGYLHTTDSKTFDLVDSDKGPNIPAADLYFRSNPMFETSSPKYAWLNHTVAVGVGRIPAQNKVSYRIYAIK